MTWTALALNCPSWELLLRKENKPLFGTKLLYSSLCSTQSLEIPANTRTGQVDKVDQNSIFQMANYSHI